MWLPEYRVGHGILPHCVCVCVCVCVGGWVGWGGFFGFFGVFWGFFGFFLGFFLGFFFWGFGFLASKGKIGANLIGSIGVNLRQFSIGVGVFRLGYCVCVFLSWGWHGPRTVPPPVPGILHLEDIQAETFLGGTYAQFFVFFRVLAKIVNCHWGFELRIWVPFLVWICIIIVQPFEFLFLVWICIIIVQPFEFLGLWGDGGVEFEFELMLERRFLTSLSFFCRFNRDLP